MSETARALLNAHVPDDDGSDDSPELRVLREEAGVILKTDDSSTFSVESIIKASKKMSLRRAPGVDMVEALAVRRAVLVIPLQFGRLLNACLAHGFFADIWKQGSLRLLLKGPEKDPTDPRLYRPICLLPVLGMLLEKLVVEGINILTLSSNGISERQYGFLPERSTEDAISKLRKLVADSKSQYTFGILFDIKGAFDNVQHAAVLSALKERSCPRNVYKLLVSYFESRKVHFE